jgi:hypothetical protein
MNYTEIKDTALGYADRADSEVTSRIDLFLKMVESRINRKIESQESVTTVQTALVDNVFEYTLPTDFRELQDIKIVNLDNENYSYPLTLSTPERITTFRMDGSDQRLFAIMGNSVQICSNPYDADLNLVLEITYKQKVPALTSVATSNWVSLNHPDVYVFGLLVEINAFIKNADATMMWDQRFNTTLDEIDVQDTRYRWSGPTLKIEVE